MPEHPEQHLSGAAPGNLADLLGQGLVSQSDQPEVVILREDREISRRLLDRSPLRIGRLKDNDVVLEDRAVSRRHAVLVNESGQWWIRDTGSRHQLHVGGKRCEAHAFKDGDRVGIGPFQLLFRSSSFEVSSAGSAASVGQRILAPDSGLDAGAPSASGLRLAIPGYEISEEIGRGGMGRVYKAVQLSTRRTVALKVLLEGPFSTEKTKKRFEREVRIAAALRHPNIAQVYESGLHQGRYWFAMEYVQGRPLDVVANDADYSLEQKLSVMATICEAVGYAHSQSVIHRDLKPGNILVTADSEPRVLDFGLAKIDDPEADHEATVSMLGDLVGTPAYMSPEQTERDPTGIDARTDVYSLGVILYRLLTGRFPYNVKGRIDEVIHEIATAQPTPPTRHDAEIDSETEAIILKALSKDPGDRYANAVELGSDLRRRLAGEPVEARLASRSYRFSKVMRRYRRPGSVAIGAAAMIMLTGWATWWIATRQQTPPYLPGLGIPTSLPVPAPDWSAGISPPIRPAPAAGETRPSSPVRLETVDQQRPLLREEPLNARALTALCELEAAVDLQLWESAAQRLEVIHREYRTSGFTGEAETGLKALEDRVQAGIRSRMATLEREAAREINRLKSLVAQQRYPEAYVVLTRLRTELSSTDAAGREKSFLDSCSQEMKSRSDVSTVKDCGDYYLLPPSGPDWEWARASCKQIARQLPYRRPSPVTGGAKEPEPTLIVLRLMTEDDSTNDRIAAQARGAQFVHYPHGGTSPVFESVRWPETRGFLFVFPDRNYHGPPGTEEHFIPPGMLTVRAMQHSTPTIPLDFQVDKTLFLGDCLLKTVQASEKGSLIVEPVFENGLRLKDETLLLNGVALQSSPGAETLHSPPVKSGGYAVSLAQNRRCCAESIPVKIEAGQIAKAAFPIWWQREMRLTWWYRAEPQAGAWQSGQKTLLVGDSLDLNDVISNGPNYIFRVSLGPAGSLKLRQGNNFLMKPLERNQTPQTTSFSFPEGSDFNRGWECAVESSECFALRSDKAQLVIKVLSIRTVEDTGSGSSDSQSAD